MAAQKAGLGLQAALFAPGIFRWPLQRGSPYCFTGAKRHVVEERWDCMHISVCVCVCVCVCVRMRSTLLAFVFVNVYSVPFSAGRSHRRPRNKAHRGQTDGTNIALTSTW